MSMQSYARDVAARLHHRGVLIERGHSNVAADLRDIANVNLADVKQAFSAWKVEVASMYGYDAPEQNKPFAYSDGVAIIPIHGMLLNRMSWSCSFATGYNFIRSQMNAALDDDDVNLIVYDVNSSGGLASGCAELSQEMFNSRLVKPSLAVVDSRCYSAAYFLASSATRIVVTPSGGVGSIGCVAMHTDLSGMLEQEGIKVTFIFDGAEKVDGNSYEPLSSRARDSIQRDVDYHYGLFVEAIARNRDLPEDDVRGTEARCFLPTEALENGLIDGVQTSTEAVAEFFNELTSDSDPEDDDVTDTKQQNGGTVASTGTVAVLSVPALTAEEVGRIAAKAAMDAVAADRSRSAAIRTCDEAKGREQLADHLAGNTNMSVEEAKAILVASPKQEAKNDTGSTTEARREPSGFAAAMDRTENPNVGADPQGTAANGGEDKSAQAVGSRLLSLYGAASGVKVPKAA